MRTFGEKVEGYNIPVLNEREVRASAGLLLLFISISIIRVAFVGDFLLLKYFVIIFLADFIVRVLVNPRFSPTLILGRWIVSKQVPEYTGAKQKKFAWTIGLIFAAIMFFLLIIVNAHSFITGSICIVCLIFLFFESAFGICLGCLVYHWLYKEKALYCPGEICEPIKKHDIQKTSRLQFFVIVAFILYIIVTIMLLNDNFSKQPRNLWKIIALNIASKQLK